MVPFAERLSVVFATLARPLTPEDGEPESDIAEAEGRLDLKVPPVLRTYYRLAGRLEQFNQAHNRLLKPEEWSVDGGKLVFLEEHQCVVFWGVEACRAPEEDPPDFQGPNDQGQPTEWFEEHGTCSEFLLVTLHLQAVWGGYEHIGGSALTPEVLKKFLVGWTPAGTVNRLQAFHRPGGAACVLEGAASLQVDFGGWTLRDFEAIESELEASGGKTRQY